MATEDITFTWYVWRSSALKPAMRDHLKQSWSFKKMVTIYGIKVFSN